MTENQAIERIAKVLASFTMDDDRCVSIGEPKTSPCGDQCGCWESAMWAAEAAWNEMKTIVREDNRVAPKMFIYNTGATLTDGMTGKSVERHHRDAKG